MEKKLIDRKELITIRDYTEADKHFVLATVLKGIYYGDWYKDIPKAIFMTNYRIIFEQLFGKSTTKIRMACLKDDPDVLLGYSICHRKDGVNILDWVYVKAAWRNIGISRMLIPNDVQLFTHRSKSGFAIAREKMPHLTFNPFVLF